MNVCALSGRVASPPLAVGDGHTIKFSLLTRYPFQRESVAREASALVPCVLFGASKDQREALLGKDRDKLRIELIGRVVRSGFENTEGMKVFNTEVVIDSSGLLIRRVK